MLERAEFSKSALSKLLVLMGFGIELVVHTILLFPKDMFPIFHVQIRFTTDSTGLHRVAYNKLCLFHLSKSST